MQMTGAYVEIQLAHVCVCDLFAISWVFWNWLLQKILTGWSARTYAYLYVRWKYVLSVHFSSVARIAPHRMFHHYFERFTPRRPPVVIAELR